MRWDDDGRDGGLMAALAGRRAVLLAWLAAELQRLPATMTGHPLGEDATAAIGELRRTCGIVPGVA